VTNFGDGLPPGCTDADVDKAHGYTEAEDIAWAYGVADYHVGFDRRDNQFDDPALAAAWEAGYDHADKEANNG